MGMIGAIPHQKRNRYVVGTKIEVRNQITTVLLRQPRDGSHRFPDDTRVLGFILAFSVHEHDDSIINRLLFLDLVGVVHGFPVGVVTELPHGEHEELQRVVSPFRIVNP